MKNRMARASLIAVVMLVAAAIVYLSNGRDSDVAIGQTTVVEQQAAGLQTLGGGNGPGLLPGKEQGSVSAARVSQEMGFRDLEFAALRGDAKAQRLLSESYERCLPYSLSPARHLGTLDSFAAMQPDSAAYVHDMKKRVVSFCSTVDDGAPIPLEAYQLWLEQAAATGDLTAKVRLKSRSPEMLDASEYQSIADEVMASRDPAALFELGNLLARAPSDSSLGKYQDLAGSSASHALEIAACRRGLACGAGSALMDGMCSGTGHCWYLDYESLIYSEFVPPGGRKRVNDALTLLEDMLSDS